MNERNRAAHVAKNQQQQTCKKVNVLSFFFFNKPALPVLQKQQGSRNTILEGDDMKESGR
jgi:hypothetical protein